MRRLLPGAQPAEWVDSTSSVCLVERDLPAAWAGRKLVELEEPGRFTLAALTRLGEARIFDGTMVGQDGDVLHFIVGTEVLDELSERLSGPPEGSGH